MRHVLQLEAALAAFGDSKGAEVTMLQQTLRSARRAAQVPPLGVQFAQCEQFVTRAQKRLAALDEERVKLVSELEEGQARLQRLRVAAAQRPQEANPAAPVPPPDWTVELQRLQSLVTQLQEKRIQLGPRHLEEVHRDMAPVISCISQCVPGQTCARCLTRLHHHHHHQVQPGCVALWCSLFV